VLSLDTTVFWSPYSGRFNQRRLGFSLWDLRGDRLTVGYRYTSDAEDLEELGLQEETVVETVRASARVVIDSRRSSHAIFERNLATEENIEVGAGFTFQSQCWGLTFDYVNETGDNRYSVIFNLLGLGSIGY